AVELVGPWCAFLSLAACLPYFCNERVSERAGRRPGRHRVGRAAGAPGGTPLGTASSPIASASPAALLALAPVGTDDGGAGCRFLKLHAPACTQIEIRADRCAV